MAIMEIDKYYRGLEDLSRNAMEQLIGDQGGLAALTKVHNLIIEYDKLNLALGQRYESHLFALGAKEFQFALFALTTGRYRHAFSGLRLSLDLMLAGVYFSAHEINYRLWVQKKRDILWGNITHSDTGIFSADFVSAFNTDLMDEAKHYAKMAGTVYRECSEYVHGNAHTHDEIPKDIRYESQLFNAWCEKADTINLVVIFAFCIRYLAFLDQQAKTSIEPIILDRLGHLAAIQAAFAEPK